MCAHAGAVATAQAALASVRKRGSFATVRKTQRLKTLVRNANLVDYWRAKGWPELCHPTTGDDFEGN